MEIIKLKPALKDIIWGGTRLITDFGFATDAERIAEAWVVSAHPNGPGVAEGGRFDGRPFPEILAAHPEYLGAGSDGKFPLLIKLIDAARDLSIQVHPDDAYAAAHEGGLGKTEMWYVLDAAPDAAIYYGFREKTTPAAFRAAIEDGSVCDLLNRVPCKPGDVFFIPAGTVHAIGAGLLICEIQQSSDITYRIFDYNRPGADGKPRPLHIAQACEAADYTPTTPDGKPAGAPVFQNGAETTLLAECPFFHTWLCRCASRASFIAGRSFELLTVLRGEGEIEQPNGTKLPIKKGDGLFVPARTGKYRVCGSLQFIRVKTTA